MAGLLGGGGVAGNGVGIDGCDSESELKETSLSPSNCIMAHICSSSALSSQFGGSTGCGHFRLRLAGGAGENRLVTATTLPAAVATSFLVAACVHFVAAAAARGAAAEGSVAITASQFWATTAAVGPAAALVAVAAPFLVAAVAADAIAAAAAAVGAAAAAVGAAAAIAFCPDLLGLGHPWFGA